MYEVYILQDTPFHNQSKVYMTDICNIYLNNTLSFYDFTL